MDFVVESKGENGMGNAYRVAIHYNEDNGYVEYKADLKTAVVMLNTPQKRAEVESYLASEHEINVPHETLMDFTKEMVRPLESLSSFQLALTRLWGATGVYVDWSRPVNG